jgi:predicted Rossmann fold nucleotide-binding protein DprA/Smf involved in DNA uptake
VRLAIVGSRPEYEEEDGLPTARYTAATLARRARVQALVEGLPPGTVVVSGGADGVDTWAEADARRRGLQVEVHRPDYRMYGRRAPLKRNDLIVARSDGVVAFWDGKSKGTAYTIEAARRLGLAVRVFKD